jgi:hypothetical protein
MGRSHFQVALALSSWPTTTGTGTDGQLQGTLLGTQGAPPQQITTKKVYRFFTQSFFQQRAHRITDIPFQRVLVLVVPVQY